MAVNVPLALAKKLPLAPVDRQVMVRSVTQASPETLAMYGNRLVARVTPPRASTFVWFAGLAGW